MLSLYIIQVIVMINVVEDSTREAWYFLTIIVSFFLGGREFGYFMFILVLLTMIIYNFQPFIETNLNDIESAVPIFLLIVIALIINLYERTR